jgi:hypothetical protein
MSGQIDSEAVDPRGPWWDELKRYGELVFGTPEEQKQLEACTILQEAIEEHCHKPETDIDPALLCEKVLGWKRIPPDGVCYEVLRRPDGKDVHPDDTPDFENVLADAWLLVDALPPEHYFMLVRRATPNLEAPAHWVAEIHVRAVFRAFRSEAAKPEQAITRARWSMYLETGK